MALKWVEGFDYLPTGSLSSGVAGAIGLYDYNNNQNFRTVAPGRFDYGKCLETGFGGARVSGYFVPVPGGPLMPEIFLGFAMRNIDFGNQVTLRSGSIDVASIEFNNPGRIAVYRGSDSEGNLIGQTASGVLFEDVWSWIEIHLKAGAGGMIEVRVNTQTVISIPAVTFIQPGIDNIGLSTVGLSICQWDDFYLCDPTGDQNNTYLGNVRVQWLAPTGPGNQTQWTPNPVELPNWQAASNQQINDNTFVKNPITEPGEYDLYTLTPLVNSPNIYGVSVKGAYRQDDATQMFVQNAIRTNGADFFGATFATDQKYSFRRDIYQVNPATGVGWTIAEVNSLQAGPRHLS